MMETCEHFRAQDREGLCFACDTPDEILRSKSFGYSYGREDFHGPTIKERQEEQLRLRPDAVPVGNRWV